MQATNEQVRKPKPSFFGHYDPKKQAFRKQYKKPSIKVFATKTKKFRARIIDPGSCIAYEVTVGGKEWRKGKGQPYQKIILEKCENLVTSLWKEILDTVPDPVID